MSLRVQHADLAGGRAPAHVGDVVDGERPAAVEVDRHALRRFTVVALAVARFVPHDRQVTAVVAQVVDQVVVIADVDRPQLHGTVEPRRQPRDVVDDHEVVGAEDVVVDARAPERLRGRVPVEEVLVVVRVAVVASHVLVPAHPLEQVAVHVGCDVVRRVVAQRLRVQLRLQRRVDVGEVVRPAATGRLRLGLVELVGGVGRHDRELRACRRRSAVPACSCRCSGPRPR